MWQIAALVFIIWFLLVKQKNKKFVELANKFPNEDRCLPIIGHAHYLLGNDEDHLKAFQNGGRQAIEHGGMVSFWLAHHLYMAVADPVIADIVLKICLEKDDTIKFIRKLTGNGVAFAPVPIWRHRRKVLVPNFAPKILKQFAEVFTKQSNIMVEQLQAVANSGPVSLWNYVSAYSMDSICETTLGVQVNAQKNADAPFLKALEEIGRLIQNRMVTPWLHPDAIYNMLPCYKKFKEQKIFICDYIDKIIKIKAASINKQQNTKSDTDSDEVKDSTERGYKTFLQMLLESPDAKYNGEELREETMVLAIAGSDTSATAISFTALMMARYPDIQEKVHKELKDIYGDSIREVCADDLPQMKYLEAAIKESMRLYPPVPIIVRDIDSDVTLPSGVTLLRGCRCVVSIWSIHRNTHYWGEDAEVFRPERFLEGPLLHPAAFMPFSYGPRMCLGYQYAMMSMKTQLATMLRKYRILPSRDDAADQPLRLRHALMLKDVDNFTVRLVSRDGISKLLEPVKN